jgi:hypothetical protein
VTSNHDTFKLVCDFKEDSAVFPIQMTMHVLPGFLVREDSKPLKDGFTFEFTWVDSSPNFLQLPKTIRCITKETNPQREISIVVDLTKVVAGAGLKKSDFRPVLPIKDGTAVQADDFAYVPCEWRNDRIQPVDHGKSEFADGNRFLSPGWWGTVFLWTGFLLLAGALAFLLRKKMTNQAS